MSDPSIIYVSPIPGSQPSDPRLFDEDGDIYVLDCRVLSIHNDLLSRIKGKTSRDKPVFILTGQRGTYEQQESRKRELRAIEDGATPLGACYANPWELGEGILEIFNGEGDTESKTEAVRNRFFVPAIESTELSPLLEFLVEGGSLELGKFMYNDFESWLKVKYSEAYQPGARALQKAGEGIIDNIIEEMGRKNIEDFYSMGPTADLDKLTLERFAQMCKKVRYHPIDISGSAIYDTKKELTDYLDKSVPGWGKYVTIVDTKPMKFDELETDKPSCLSFPGGQIMNINGLLDMAGRLCKEDGLVVADLHQRGSDNDGAFWLPQYDTPEGREMFRKGVLQFLPGLEKRDGWGIAYKYIEGTPNRISVQLDIQKPMEVWCNMVKLDLEPGVERELIFSKKYTPGSFTGDAVNHNFIPLIYNKIPIDLVGPNGETGFGTSVIMEYQPNQVRTQGVKVPLVQSVGNRKELVLQTSNT